MQTNHALQAVTQPLHEMHEFIRSNALLITFNTSTYHRSFRSPLAPHVCPMRELMSSTPDAMMQSFASRANLLKSGTDQGEESSNKSIYCKRR